MVNGRNIERASKRDKKKKKKETRNEKERETIEYERKLLKEFWGQVTAGEWDTEDAGRKNDPRSVRKGKETRNHNHREKAK